MKHALGYRSNYKPAKIGKKRGNKCKEQKKSRGKRIHARKQNFSITKEKNPKAIQDTTCLWSTPSFTVICESPYEGRNLVICISEG